jgi:hypothetical protein
MRGQDVIDRGELKQPNNRLAGMALRQSCLELLSPPEKGLTRKQLVVKREFLEGLRLRLRPSRKCCSSGARRLSPAREPHGVLSTGALDR